MNVSTFTTTTRESVYVARTNFATLVYVYVCVYSARANATHSVRTYIIIDGARARLEAACTQVCNKQERARRVARNITSYISVLSLRATRKG